MSFFARFRRPPPPAETPSVPDDLSPPEGFRAGVESYCWRVLVQAYVRVLARQQGREWSTISDREAHAMLEPYHRDLDRDVRALGVAIDQARAEGMSRMRDAVHRAPGLDREMVDEAIQFGFSQSEQKKEGKR